MEMDRKAWHAKVHGVAKSQTQLSKWTTTSPTCPAPVGTSSQHTWCCQGPRNPSSCTTSTPSPHWGRRKSSSAASGANSMDDSHTEVGEKPQPNSRGSVAKKEDQNHLHELYKLIKPTWSTWKTLLSISVSVQSLSHVQLCDPMDCSTSGFPAHHQLPGLAQTHVHQIFDVIQPHHPLSFLSPPTFNLSQHQGLFQWVSSSHHQVAKVLELWLQHQSFQWIFRTQFL